MFLAINFKTPFRYLQAEAFQLHTQHTLEREQHPLKNNNKGSPESHIRRQKNDAKVFGVIYSSSLNRRMLWGFWNVSRNSDVLCRERFLRMQPASRSDSGMAGLKSVLPSAGGS